MQKVPPMGKKEGITITLLKSIFKSVKSKLIKKWLIFSTKTVETILRPLFFLLVGNKGVAAKSALYCRYGNLKAMYIYILKHICVEIIFSCNACSINLDLLPLDNSSIVLTILAFKRTLIICFFLEASIFLRPAFTRAPPRLSFFTVCLITKNPFQLSLNLCDFNLCITFINLFELFPTTKLCCTVRLETRT